MLIMNQSKDKIYNLKNIQRISTHKDPNAGRKMCYIEVDEKYTIGTYESESRAKEVLMELFDAVNGWDDRFIMPDK